MAVENDTDLEVEVFGVTYERYALERLFERLADQLRIKTVIELPASGAKAMPSLYSLGFALAGCQVTLVDADPIGVGIWHELGLGDNLQIVGDSQIGIMLAEGHRWDLCWNFAVLPTVTNPEQTAQRMAQCTADYWMVVHINRFNVGFNMHRTVHRFWKVPWTHGDVDFFSPFKTARFMHRLGLKNVHWGVVDCPPWPDSPGFRDLRLHRSTQKERAWVSPYVNRVKQGNFPLWMKWVYWGERLPLPTALKLPYAHLFYAIGQVDHEVDQ